MNKKLLVWMFALILIISSIYAAEPANELQSALELRLQIIDALNRVTDPDIDKTITENIIKDVKGEYKKILDDSVLKLNAIDSSIDQYKTPDKYNEGVSILNGLSKDIGKIPEYSVVYEESQELLKKIRSVRAKLNKAKIEEEQKREQIAKKSARNKTIGWGIGIVVALAIMGGAGFIVRKKYQKRKKEVDEKKFDSKEKRIAEILRIIQLLETKKTAIITKINDIVKDKQNLKDQNKLKETIIKFRKSKEDAAFFMDRLSPSGRAIKKEAEVIIDIYEKEKEFYKMLSELEVVENQLIRVLELFLNMDYEGLQTQDKEVIKNRIKGYINYVQNNVLSTLEKFKDLVEEIQGNINKLNILFRMNVVARVKGDWKKNKGEIENKLLGYWGDENNKGTQQETLEKLDEEINNELNEGKELREIFSQIDKIKSMTPLVSPITIEPEQYNDKIIPKGTEIQFKATLTGFEPIEFFWLIENNLFQQQNEVVDIKKLIFKDLLRTGPGVIITNKYKTTRIGLHKIKLVYRNKYTNKLMVRVNNFEVGGLYDHYVAAYFEGQPTECKIICTPEGEQQKELKFKDAPVLIGKYEESRNFGIQIIHERYELERQDPKALSGGAYYIKVHLKERGISQADKDTALLINIVNDSAKIINDIDAFINALKNGEI